MPADLCVAVPAWNRETMLIECLRSLKGNTDVSMEITVIDDRSSDGTRGVAEEFGCKVIDGPGYCNWRPGAIHWPVFHTWLVTKCPYITYIFSDDRSRAPRLAAQLRAMKEKGFAATFANTTLLDVDGYPSRTVKPKTGDFSFGGIPAYTETLVIDRKKFVEAGGLDYPIHVAAQAEAWIWAAAGAAGRIAYVDVDGFQFRKHPGTLTNDAKNKYAEATAVTEFLEEDHWELWKRVTPRFFELVARAEANARGILEG